MIKSKIEIWKNMPRNNPEELALADKFYDDELMPLSAAKFVREQGVAKEYYALFLTLGTSWQPLALSIMALKPQKICLMGTAKTMELVPQLIAFAGLDKNNIVCEIVDRSDVETIYASITKNYDFWKLKGNCCIDITGGTKAMASGAAMMGAVLGMDIYYVESKYLPLYRRPEPGSEYLKKLANPGEWLVR
ncbi:MAG: hypothetical protein Q4D21_03075 [Phascolarctobacterium sp.]|nr:hypothetical protein [Phascolarctobacterium sp.]